MITEEIIKVVKQEVLDHKSWPEIQKELRFNSWTESDIKLIYAIVFQNGKVADIADKNAKEFIETSKPRKVLNWERIAILFVLFFIFILVDILIIQVNPQGMFNIRTNLILLQENATNLIKK